MLCVAPGSIGIAAPSVFANTDQFAARALFRDTRAKYRAGQRVDLAKVTAELGDYVLAPYLSYYYINDRISSVGQRQILSFLQDNPTLPATAILKRRWLKSLGARRQWRTLLEHYEPSSDPALRCYHLRALYNSRDKTTALSQTASIWVQPSSQPKACDPLFEVWQQSEFFNEDVAWQRLSAAIGANQRSLASYLIRFFSGSNKRAAEAYYRVHVGPSRIARTHEYATDSAKMRTVIAHGVARLAKRDAPLAKEAWSKYQRSHQFEATLARYTSDLVAIELAEDESVFPSNKQRKEIVAPDTIEAIANAAVENQAWEQAQYWIERLPADIAQKSQWQYWRARSIQQLTPGDVASIEQAFRSIASERHYYGFLAAQKLGIPGSMNAIDLIPSQIELNKIRNTPHLARSIELYAIGDDINARREWFRALEGMNQREQVVAAELARELGLTTMAIRSANIAEARNHLDLRFPIAHEPEFRRANLKTQLPVAFMLAIARQESAMEAKARSSADARGLMQLLPSTARLVARRAKQAAPQANDLYDPGTNISLGSYHLAWLMQRYDQQSPLAIAAYNAGEHRADRWIKEAEDMPIDVWIERIPFRETRNYVKNVLAFRHVYAARIGVPLPLLSSQEQRVRPRRK